MSGIGVVPGTEGNASKNSLSNRGEGSEPSDPADDNDVHDVGRDESAEPGGSNESLDVSSTSPTFWA